jgi:hypothetical protein
MKTIMFTTAALIVLVRPVIAQPTQTAQPAQPGQPALPAQPAPAPTLPPATGAAQPANPYPTGYPYSPGYAYPPAYGSPAPYPYGYPPAPQGYSPYASPYPAYPPAYPPAYGQPPAAGYPPAAYAEPPPAPVPSGRWRLGASLMLVPKGTLSYSLNYKGEPLLAYSGDTATTAGVVPYLQLDLFRYVYLAFAVQILPSLKWSGTSATSSSSGNNIFGGSGKEVDFLPQVGLSIPASRRIRILAFAAPGYSLLFASNLVKVYADPGTAHGLVFQTGFGMVLSLGEHAFLDFRGTQQWGFQNNKVQSATTGVSADVEVHSRFFGLQAGAGYWF